MSKKKFSLCCLLVLFLLATAKFAPTRRSAHAQLLTTTFAAPDAPQTAAQIYGVDAAAVFENNNDIYYSFYGHTAVAPAPDQDPRIPRPLDQPQNWSWWSIGAAGEADTTTKTRPLVETADYEWQPDIAFSREGFALAAWARESEPEYTFCVDPYGNPNSYPQVRGHLETAVLQPQPDGDVEWLAGPTIAPPANTPTTSHVYHFPSVAIDNNGTALLVWAYTIVNHHPDCSRDATVQILSRRWDGSAWVDEQGVMPAHETPCNPFTYGYLFFSCPHFTDITFTATLVAGGETRQQAMAAWNDYIEPGVTCSGLLPLQWPKTAVWDGNSWSAPEEIPGRPYLTWLGGNHQKLGLSADQHGNVRLLFPMLYDTDPCTPPDTLSHTRYANWDGDSWSDGLVLDEGISPDVALLAENTAVGVYVDADALKWATADTDGDWTPSGDITTGTFVGMPSVAAVHATGGDAARTVAVWTDGGSNMRFSERIGDGGWSTAVTLGTGVGHIELAAHTGSPSLPLAEWSYIGYLAADNDLHSFIAEDDRTEIVGVGSTALVNMVLLTDPQFTMPFPDGDARYEYAKQDDPVARQNLGELDTGDPNALRDYLAWAVEMYPAERYMLDLADHGAGWKQLCEDVTAGDDWLSLPELRDAFTAVQGGSAHSWNIIAFSACLMAQLEVAYQIRDQGNMMVASEELMPGPGPHYDDLMNDLIANPFRTDGAQAQEMVTIFQNNYLGGAGDDALETLAAIDLGQVAALAGNVDDFATALNGWLTDGTVPPETLVLRLANIQAQRNTAEEFPHALYQATYSAEGYRDLDHFAELVHDSLLPDDPTTTLDDVVRATAGDVRATLATAVLQNFADTGHPDARALSIYLEGAEAAWLAHQAAYGETEFGSDMPAWGQFLANQADEGLSFLLELTGDSADLWLRVTENDGGEIGLLTDGGTRCDGRCGVSLSEGICSRFGGRTYIVVPGESGLVGTAKAPTTDYQLVWTIDGSLLQMTAAYSLTIQVVQSGVISTTLFSGNLDPGQIISDTFTYTLPDPPTPTPSATPPSPTPTPSATPPSPTPTPSATPPSPTPTPSATPPSPTPTPSATLPPPPEFAVYLPLVVK
jgi:hypothetical protein